MNRAMPSRLRGWIRPLCLEHADGWQSREIIVKQEDGYRYPDVGDSLELMDTDGAEYKLKFIKGANRAGHALIGQPGVLKPWFLKRYSFDRVERDEVNLELVEGTNRYHILCTKEWFRKV